MKSVVRDLGTARSLCREIRIGVHCCRESRFPLVMGTSCQPKGTHICLLKGMPKLQHVYLFDMPAEPASVATAILRSTQ